MEISSWYNMCHAYCFGWNSGWKKMQFQLALKKPFCPIPPPPIHQRFKHRQRTKINETVLLTSPSSVFHTKFTMSVYWKASKYSILTEIELGPPVSESSTGSQHFMPPLILNTNFIIEIKFQISNRKLAIHRIQSHTHNHYTMFHL